METFKVGDRVYLTLTKHFGTIAHVSIQRPHNQPDAIGVRCYDIQLDDGGKIIMVAHGIERAAE